LKQALSFHKKVVKLIHSGCNVNTGFQDAC